MDLLALQKLYDLVLIVTWNILQKTLLLLNLGLAHK